LGHLIKGLLNYIFTSTVIVWRQVTEQL